MSAQTVLRSLVRIVGLAAFGVGCWHLRDFPEAYRDSRAALAAAAAVATPGHPATRWMPVVIDEVIARMCLFDVALPLIVIGLGVATVRRSVVAPSFLVAALIQCIGASLCHLPPPILMCAPRPGALIVPGLFAAVGVALPFANRLRRRRARVTPSDASPGIGE
jgi:hypothetical protein